MAKPVANVPADARKAIGKAFPALAKIKDASLREGVVKTWYMAWKESSYKRLEDAPMGVGRPEDSLLKHVNAVTGSAYAIGQQLQQVYGTKLNFDYVIAGALLHDVDKIVMYEGTGDKAKHSALSEKIVHGAYGGHLALLAGLPMDIVFIIMAHSPKVDVEPDSPEGQLICHADLAVARTPKGVTDKPRAGSPH
ncbi:MAG: hypothetical protein Q7T26_00835 [Dehalococcoidia bacterium]|nr:hypothetical protein [Dehalococcoidia bacterium]